MKSETFFLLRASREFIASVDDAVFYIIQTPMPVQMNKKFGCVAEFRQYFLLLYPSVCNF